MTPLRRSLDPQSVSPVWIRPDKDASAFGGDLSQRRFVTVTSGLALPHPRGQGGVAGDWGGAPLTSWGHSRSPTTLGRVFRIQCLLLSWKTSPTPQVPVTASPFLLRGQGNSTQRNPSWASPTPAAHSLLHLQPVSLSSPFLGSLIHPPCGSSTPISGRFCGLRFRRRDGPAAFHWRFRPPV